METLFETPSVNKILRRIEMLTPVTPRRWGKMNVAQMMAHCAECMEMAMGNKKVQRSLIGRLVGPMLKHKVLDENPLDKNLPTDKDMLMVGPKDFAQEKQRLMDNIKRFTAAGRQGIPSHAHPFFGKMTTEEWARSACKHLDHHLQQFGA
ncbi:MAG TPA: DUF1569 domain-containing protein [Flavipsychrobacter sp.]|nr:DUF1569 domain-containing protein [Flavipsychrobacter sp.]